MIVIREFLFIERLLYVKVYFLVVVFIVFYQQVLLSIYFRDDKIEIQKNNYLVGIRFFKLGQIVYSFSDSNGYRGVLFILDVLGQEGVLDFGSTGQKVCEVDMVVLRLGGQREGSD